MSTGIVTAIEAIPDLTWRFLPIFRIRRYRATEFSSVYGVMRPSFPNSPRASMRTCRHHQPAKHPSAHLTVPTGLARLTTVFRRAIKALRYFPCYFPHIAIYHDSFLRSGMFESGCAHQ